MPVNHMVVRILSWMVFHLMSVSDGSSGMQALLPEQGH